MSASMEPVGSEDISLQSRWMGQGTEKVLLLPHDYGGYQAAVRNNHLAIGFESGRVSILEIELS